MTDVSVPPTPFDDEFVTRKILREELARQMADISSQIRSMEERLIALMTALLEPSSDHGPRLTQLEARTTVLAHRVDALEAPRTARRKPARKRPRKRTSRK